MQLQPLVNALAAELLRQPVLHADETPTAKLEPGWHTPHRNVTVSSFADQSLRIVPAPYKSAPDSCRGARGPAGRDWQTLYEHEVGLVFAEGLAAHH